MHFYVTVPQIDTTRPQNQNLVDFIPWTLIRVLLNYVGVFSGLEEAHMVTVKRIIRGVLSSHKIIIQMVNMLKLANYTTSPHERMIFGLFCDATVENIKTVLEIGPLIRQIFWYWFNKPIQVAVVNKYGTMWLPYVII